jgi:hypothetical protein
MLIGSRRPSRSYGWAAEGVEVAMTSSIWSDSVGGRAYAYMRAKPAGTVLTSIDLAHALGVGTRALHTLLANAIELHLLEKIHVPGWKCSGWQVGPARAPRIEHRAVPPSERGTGKRRTRTPRERSVTPFRSLRWPAASWIFDVPAPTTLAPPAAAAAAPTLEHAAADVEASPASLWPIPRTNCTSAANARRTM